MWMKLQLIGMALLIVVNLTFTASILHAYFDKGIFSRDSACLFFFAAFVSLAFLCLVLFIPMMRAL